MLMCKVWRKSGQLSFRGVPCHWELADVQICVVGLFIWRWRYSGAVLLQEGKTFVVGDRLLPSFFCVMGDQQLTNIRNENLKTYIKINSLDNS